MAVHLAQYTLTRTMSHRPIAVSAAQLVHNSSDEQTHPPPPAYELVPPIMPAEVAAENRPTLPFRARNLWLHEGSESRWCWS